MTRSIRNRLQWWYGLVYVTSIVVFGCLVYWRADREAHERLAQQVVSAAQYLDVSLRTVPPRWMNQGAGFPEGPPGERPPLEGPPRNGDGPRFGPGPLGRGFDQRPPRERRPGDDRQGDDPRADEPRGDEPMDFELRDGTQRGDELPDDAPRRQSPERRRGSESRPTNEGRTAGEGTRLPDGRRGFNMPTAGLSRDEGMRPPILPEPARDNRGPLNTDRPPEPQIEFAIWREDGTLLMSDGDQLVPLITKPPLPGRDLSPTVRFERDFVQATKRGPYATIIMTLRSTRQEFGNLQRFGYQMAGIGLLLLTTGLLGGWWISGRMVQPIQRISATASRISAAHLSARIETQDLDQELVELGSVLNEAFSRLQNSFERLTQFTADASHELRTPLAVIQAQIELTLSQPRSSEVYQQTLQTCLNSTHRLQSMVDGLLLLARADAERLNLGRHRFDLRTVAEDVCVQLQSQAIEAGVELDCFTPENPVWIAGDPAFLARVPFNLIDNALQQTPRDGKVTVRVEMCIERQLALLIVTDTGCGIAAEHLPHVFERFYRIDVDRSRKRGGSGLGLAICRSLVTAHGGQISCESRLGNGAVFTAGFPLADSPSPP